MKKLAYKVVASIIGPVGGIWVFMEFYALQKFFVLRVFPWAPTYEFPSGDVGATGILAILATLLSLACICVVLGNHFERE